MRQENPLSHELGHYTELKREPPIHSGSYLPKKILTNQEIESWNLRKNEKGKPLSAHAIIETTGVEERHFANSTETPLYMGLQAAQQALNGEKAEIIIVSTSFPQGFNVSKRISEELGYLPSCNLDVHAACSGFTRSLAYLKKNEKQFAGQRVLLISTEKYSPFLHDLKTEGRLSDPTLAQTLFTDEAHAISFKLEKDIEILSALNYKFPQEVSNLIKMPVDPKLMVSPFIYEPVPYSESEKFEQSGHEVIVQIKNNIGKLIIDVMEQAKLKASEIQKIFPHQGSRPMTEAVAGVLSEYSIYKDYKQGNASSGSIPRALIKAINQGEINRNDKLILAGFGAGLFASIVVVRI